MSGCRASIRKGIRLRRATGRWLAVCLTLAALSRSALSADEPPPSANAIVAAVTAIEAEAARYRSAPPLQLRTPSLVLAIGGVFQGKTQAYADDRLRFLAVELIAANTSPVAATLDVQGIRLRTGGQSLTWKERPEGMDGFSFQAGRANITIREVQPPDALAIPPGGSASTWLLFAGLEPGTFVPDLVLEIPGEPQPTALDVALFERARLILRVQRLGPADALGVVSIGGPLNTVNAASLVGELDALTAAGVHRVVLDFAPDAIPTSQFLLDWLQQARQPNPYQQQFKQMPVFPTTLHELHLVLPTKDVFEVGPQVHLRLGDAVTAALRSAFTALSADEVLRSLRSESPAVRAAALVHGAERLRPEHLPAVLRFVEAPEPEVRRAALVALSAFSAAESVDTLARFAQSPDRELSVAAVRSLAASRFPEAHQALARLIRDGRLTFDEERVSLLAAFPRPEWNRTFLELTAATDSKVQQSALQALARLGDEQLLAVLAQGLKSDAARVREEAFQRLSEMESREADALAIDYALQRLQTEPPSASIKQFLERVRDQRAVPLLIKYLDSPEGVRRSVIELLAAIGDQSVAAELARRYPTFSDSEKVLTLTALQGLDSTLGRPLAISGLRADDISLVQHSVTYLQADATDAAVQALAQALQDLRGKPNHAGINLVCGGLGGIATLAARDILLTARESDDDQTRQAARQGLQVLWNQSPARELVAQAEVELNRMRVYSRTRFRGELAELNRLTPEQRREVVDRAQRAAQQLLSSAERIDPDLPDLAHQQGVLLAIEGQSDAAVTRLNHAIELHPELVEAQIELGDILYKSERFAESIAPLKYAFENDTSERRHQWLTCWSLALIRLGQMEDAIALVRQHAATFPDEPIFKYNVACIYGRAVELLRRDPLVAADDPRITVFAETAVEQLTEAFADSIERHADDPDMYAFMRDDPDLAPLHDLSVFRKFADLDLPEDQRKKSPPPETYVPAEPGDDADPALPAVDADAFGAL